MDAKKKLNRPVKENTRVGLIKYKAGNERIILK